MVFSADDRVLIKVLRQEKGYGAKNSSQNFPASQIWGKLKSRLIEEWEHFRQVFIDEAIRQWRPRLRACIRAHILNIALTHIL